MAVPHPETSQQQKDIAMTSHNATNCTSPAITYPSPIEFNSFEDFVDRVQDAISALEGAGADFVATDATEFLKSIDPETGPADLRWLGDLIERNYERFKSEIGAHAPDDGVDFLEPTMPTPDPDFVEMTPEDEANIKGDRYDRVNEEMSKLHSVIDRRLPRQS